MRKTRTVYRSCAVAASLCVCVWIARRLLCPALPIENATWIMPDQDVHYGDFQWLDDRDIVMSAPTAQDCPRLVRANLGNGTTVALAGANDRYMALARSNLKQPISSRAVFSPDARWVLVSDFRQCDNRSEKQDVAFRRRVVGLALDGTQHVDISKQQPDSCVVWSSDSRHWMEIAADTVVVHTLDQSGRVVRLPIKTQASLHAPYLATDNILVVTPTNHVITAVWSHYKNTSLPVLWDIDLRSNPVAARSTVVRTPPDIEIEQVAASPDGNRIAWQWADYGADGPPAWLVRLIPVFKVRRGLPRRELWISDSLGRDMREVGTVELRREDPGIGHAGSLFWSRDGLKLYFARGNGLWCLPVP